MNPMCVNHLGHVCVNQAMCVIEPLFCHTSAAVHRSEWCEWQVPAWRPAGTRVVEAAIGDTGWSTVPEHRLDPPRPH